MIEDMLTVQEFVGDAEFIGLGRFDLDSLPKQIYRFDW
jgi:hypothetical protein